jgi:hypothetical protein
LTFNGLQGVISQKTVLFITTAVRTSNPTIFILFILFSYLLFNSDYEASDCIMIGVIGKDVKGSGIDLIQGSSYSGICLAGRGGLGKPQNTSGRWERNVKMQFRELSLNM